MSTAILAAEKLQKHGVKAQPKGDFRLTFGNEERVQPARLVLFSAILAETLVEKEDCGKYSYQIEKRW